MMFNLQGVQIGYYFEYRDPLFATAVAPVVSCFPNTAIFDCEVDIRGSIMGNIVSPYIPLSLYWRLACVAAILLNNVLSLMNHQDLEKKVDGGSILGHPPGVFFKEPAKFSPKKNNPRLVRWGLAQKSETIFDVFGAWRSE